jgi:hypothetical protein
LFRFAVSLTYRFVSLTYRLVCFTSLTDDVEMMCNPASLHVGSNESGSGSGGGGGGGDDDYNHDGAIAEESGEDDDYSDDDEYTDGDSYSWLRDARVTFRCLLSRQLIIFFNMDVLYLSFSFPQATVAATTVRSTTTTTTTTAVTKCAIQWAAAAVARGWTSACCLVTRH